MTSQCCQVWYKTIQIKVIKFVAVVTFLLLDNIIVVAWQNFKGYYGPFAKCVSFFLATSLNPNFANVQHFQAVQEVSNMTARDIA